MLQLKCSQVCWRVDESRLSDTHTENELTRQKMEGEGYQKGSYKHMQKAGENASPGYEVRKSDDNDDNDDQIIVVVVIQDEKF